MTPHVNPRPLLSAGLLLGVGMGGFVDGIVFHQILQIHNMLSARRPPTTLANIEINMVWDGLFHAFTWLVTALGLYLLFRAGRRSDVPWSGRMLLGAMLAGWGLFNLVEGVVNHHLLGLHHVRPGPDQALYDIGFLVLGALLVGAGLAWSAASRSVIRPG